MASQEAFNGDFQIGNESAADPLVQCCGKGIPNASIGEFMNRSVRQIAFSLLLLFASSSGLGGCERGEVTRESVDALLNEGRADEALELVRSALDHDPDRADLQMVYGRLLVARREFYLALWPLREAARAPEYAIEARLLQARTQLTIGNNEEALAAVAEIFEREPENQEALSIQSSAHLAAMQLELALEDTDQLIELYPDDLAPVLTRVQALLLLERAEEAEETLTDLAARLKEDPGSHPLALRARVCAAEARFKLESGDSEGWLEKASACADEFPSDHTTLKEILDALAQRQDSEKAMLRINAALEAAPGDRELRFLLAEQHRKLGDSAAAEELLREGIALFERERAQDWRSLYEHFWQIKDFPQALAALERMIELTPNPSTADLLTLGDTLIEAGDLERAKEVAGRLDEGYRNLLMGRILITQRDLDGAREALHAGIRQWPNNAVARLLLGQVAASLGNLDEAMNEYIEAYRIDYGHNSPGYEKTASAKEVGRIQLALGSFEQGAEFLINHIQSHPADLEALELLVLAGARAGKTDFVASSLRQLAAVPAGFPRAVALQAELTSEVEGPAAAIRTIARWKPDLTSPTNAQILAVLLHQLALVGNHDKAIETAREATVAHPELAIFYALHAQTLERAGRDAKEVASTLDKAFRLDPESHLAAMVRGDLEAATGNLDAALEAYNQAALADTSSSEPGLAAGRLLAQHPQKQAEARVRFEQLLVDHPLESRAATALAILALEDRKAPDLERALESASRAARFAGILWPKDAAHAFFILGRVQVARGDEEHARTSFGIALKLDDENEMARTMLSQLDETSGEQG